MASSRPGYGISNLAKIVANIFISFIGAGLLGLPFAFKEAGILEGALIMSVVGYLSVAAMLMLVDCKYAILLSGGRSGGRSITIESKVPLLISESSNEEEELNHVSNSSSFSDLTYGDIGLYALGTFGKRLVDITIIVSQTGFCCGYLIYLCENLKKVVGGSTQGQWLMLLLPPIYGLTLLRHLNKLAIFSIFAQVSNIFALAVVFCFDFSHMQEVSFHPKEVSLKGFPFFFAVSIYCYEGAGMILSLEGSVSEQKKRKFKTIFVSTMMALTVLYISFGASGYISFGPYTQQIITLNLKHGSSVINIAAIVKVCLGISFFFTYPLMLFPVTHLIDKTLGFQDNLMRGNFVRLVLVIITGLVVILIPSFAILASLIGATCCTLLAFILPAIFHMSIFKHRLTKRQRYFDYLLIILGIIGTIIGLWDTYHRIINQPAELNDIKSSSYIPVSKIYQMQELNSSLFTNVSYDDNIKSITDKIYPTKTKFRANSDIGHDQFNTISFRNNNPNLSQKIIESSLTNNNSDSVIYKDSIGAKLLSSRKVTSPSTSLLLKDNLEIESPIKFQMNFENSSSYEN